MCVHGRSGCRNLIRCAPTIGTEIGLAQQNDRLSTALPDRPEVPLEAAGIEIRIQRHDDECDVYVCDDNLLCRALASDLARELGAARQYFMNQGFSFREDRGHCNPVPNSRKSRPV
jgi:hypothetical protein